MKVALYARVATQDTWRRQSFPVRRRGIRYAVPWEVIGGLIPLPRGRAENGRVFAFFSSRPRASTEETSQAETAWLREEGSERDDQHRCSGTGRPDRCGSLVWINPYLP